MSKVNTDLKKTLIVVAILLLTGAGYFTYQKWMKHANITAWSFVPSDAALVIDTEIMEDFRTFQGYPVGDIINQSTGFNNLKKGLVFLDSINGDGGFSAMFEKASTLASLHKIASNQLDFLFIVELGNISQNTFANATIGQLQERGYRFKTRNYHDFKISEISNENQTLTFIFYKNFFLASFTPYLVEDAVRAISDPDHLSFREQFTQLSHSTSSDIASFHLNYEKFGDLIQAFAQTQLNFPLLSGEYELALDSSFFQLSGFSTANKSWTKLHSSQPTTFEMAEIIPENTAYLYHITSSEIDQWKQKQIDLLRSSNPTIKNYQDSLKNLYDFDATQVFDLIDNELGIATLESPRVQERQKLVILEVNEMEEALAFFSKLTQRVALARGDSVYTESYSDNEIRFLPIREFPSTILGKAANGFEQCFYIGYRNYLILSNDLQQLKNLISSIQEEVTWGKSIRMNSFLEHTNNTANVSLFVNIPRTWNTIISSLKPEWTEHFKQNSSTYTLIELAAFQLSYLDNQFFTNYTFSQPVKQAKNAPKADTENGVRFISTLTTKPYLLRSHTHKSFDILLQDSTHTVYYLDPNQNAIWSEQIDGAIRGNVFPLDYYRNGKIQYLFATSKQVYIIDRTGKLLPGYPKALPQGGVIQHLNLIDYDKSRNYRIAITDNAGNIYLTDKDLNVLNGWNPRKMNAAGIVPLDHKRMGRRDIMLSVQENGTINIMNRRSEMNSGFPFDTKQVLDHHYFIKSSNTLENSSLSVISKGGELTEVNIKGDVIRRDQFIKTSADANFQLIPDTGGNSFIVVRNEGNSYEVLDETGNLLFKKDYLSQTPVIIQYYQFGAGKDLVVFTDPSTKSLYIYDKSGNLLTGKPLNSSHEISLIYSSAKRVFKVFSSWDTNLELYTFSY